MSDETKELMAAIGLTAVGIGALVAFGVSLGAL